MGLRFEVGRLVPELWLGRRVHVVVDRPLGSLHPRHHWVYPVNYGYVPTLFSPDGSELDVYVVGEDRPLVELSGTVVGVVCRRDDVEDKLVVARRPGPWSAEELSALVAFQEQHFASVVHVGS